MAVKEYLQFDSWHSCFHASITSDESYDLYFADCVELVESIVETNQLPPGISVHTDEFLFTVFPVLLHALFAVKKIAKAVLQS
jgi:hypothetical protein